MTTKDNQLQDEKISMLDAPEKIYLQIGDTDFEEVKENGWSWSDLSEITWCEDKTDQCDIPYIRADLAKLTTTQDESVSVEPTAMRLIIDGLPLTWRDYDKDFIDKVSRRNDVAIELAYLSPTAIPQEAISPAIAEYKREIYQEIHDLIEKQLRNGQDGCIDALYVMSVIRERIASKPKCFE